MNVLAISDTHFPFHHPDMFDFMADLKREYKPKVVVHIGDLGDQHGWSRHEHMPSAPGQSTEDKLTVEACNKLYNIFPNVLACIGNHDTRLAKACVRSGVPERLHRSVAEVYDSPRGWKWAWNHLVDGVAYIHGEGYSGKYPASLAATEHRMPTVIGHIHSAASIYYNRSQFNTIWGMSIGCLVDEDSPGLAYGRRQRARPIIGCGVVLDGVPHLVGMR